VKKIISFLNTDIKIINSYFLFTIVLIILVCVGYSSYALFSFTKTSTNVIEATVGEISTTGADTLIKLTDNKDNSGLYTITHAADSTLQIGTNESVTEYRYRGASPKNYVTFNNEVWRIIGIFPTDDGTGKIENRIKIIRDQSIGNKYWNTTQVASTSSYNNWAGATLKTELNTTYLTGLTRTSQSMIGDAKYYLGGYKTSVIQKDVMYQYERKIKNTTSNEFYYGTNPNSWVGKLALMYASDYGYSASNECTQTLNYYNNTICKNNTWLYNSAYEWTLPQDSRNILSALNVNLDGFVSSTEVYGSQLAVRPVLYLISSVKITGGSGTSTNPYTLSLSKNEDTSGANAPVLASNMIPVYYDATAKVWKKADTSNKKIENRWYNYDNHIWANAVTVTSTNRTTYLNAKVGTEIPMTDINTMWVWIPRFNAVTPSNYNGGTAAAPGAVNVTFVKQNETAIDAFTFGNKELSGFWYGKFEIGGSLASSCTNETCNVSNIVVKPNVSSLRSQKVSSFFYASRSMEQAGNSFGFVNSEVDTHMSKNNEWGAVAYLTQSIYGRCTSSTTCTEVGINNNSGYITGYGAPAGSSSSVTNGTYNTALGKDASTTGTIYGIYDMSGGAYEYVMGVYNNAKSSSGFNSLPDEKYYNNYTGSSYTGHALTETKKWYGDNDGFVSASYPWFARGGYYGAGGVTGVFYFSSHDGNSINSHSSHLVISNE